MKRIIIIIFFTLFCNISFAQVWQSVANFIGNGRSRSGAFGIGDTGYIIAGGSNSLGYLDDDFAYNAATNSWLSIPPYPGMGRDAVLGFAINGRGYAGLGSPGGCQFYNDYWEYDPSTSSWTQIKPFLGAGRSFAVEFVIGNIAYVGGGVNENNGICNGHPYNDFYAYNATTGNWTQIASCPDSGINSQAAAFAVDNKGYVGTGFFVDSTNGAYTPMQELWEYDPVANTWTRKANFPGAPRGGAVAFANCDKGYMGCGYSNVSGSYFNDFYEYDPVEDRWTQLANYAGDVRAFPSVFIIGKYAYVGLGANYSTGENPLDFYEYIPVDTPAFTTIPSPASICAGQSITFTDTSDYSPTNWSWSFPGGTPDTSSLQNPTIQYGSSGQYDVILTAWNTCDSGTKVFPSYVMVKPFPLKPDLPRDTIFCSAFSLPLNAGSTEFSYLWSTGDTIPAITVDTPGVYWLRVYNSCDTLYDTANVILELPPQVALGNDTSYCSSFTRTLIAGDSATLATYKWSTGATTPTITVTTLGNYWVTVSNSCGQATDTIRITGCEGGYILPNAFTPGGDDANSLIGLIKTGGGTTALNFFHIYNRWGQLIFSTDDDQAKWDGTFNGKPEQVGVYVYVVSYIDSLGKSKLLKGNITLLR